MNLFSIISQPLFTTSSPTFAGATIGSTTAMLKRVAGVLADAAAGTDYDNYWTRTGTVMTTRTAGDSLTLGADAVTAGSIKLWSANAGHFYSTFTASASQSANADYILPVAKPPSVSQFLQCTTGGVLSWASVAAPLSFGTTTQIPYMNVAGTDFLYSANLTFDGTTLTNTGEIVNGNISAPDGPELLDDPGFDDATKWTIGAHWTVNDPSYLSEARHTGTIASETLTEVTPFVAIVGATYYVSIDVSTLSGATGKFSVSVGGASTGTIQVKTGPYNCLLTTTTTAGLVITSGGTGSGTIRLNSISVKLTRDISTGGIGSFFKVALGHYGSNAATKLCVGTSNVPSNAYAGYQEIITTLSLPALSALTCGQYIEISHATTAVPSNGLSMGGAFFNTSSGDIKDFTSTSSSCSLVGLYGGSTTVFTNTTPNPVGNKNISLFGLNFNVYNNADWAPTTPNAQTINTTGIFVNSQLGYTGKTISGVSPANNYGAQLQAAMWGTFNSTSAGVNYGAKITVTDSFLVASTGTVTSYGLHLTVPVSRVFTVSGGVTSWGIYQVGAVNNALTGNTRIGGVTAPTVACDVTGAILASTTIESTTGFRYNGVAGIDATVTYIDTLLGAKTLTFQKGILTAQV